MAADRCFAESRDGKKCRALVGGKCIGHVRCPFYATSAQCEASTLRVYARLRRLPKIKQDYIAKKYYFGKYPWNEFEG